MCCFSPLNFILHNLVFHSSSNTSWSFRRLFMYMVFSAWNASFPLCWKMYMSSILPIAAHCMCSGNEQIFTEWKNELSLYPQTKLLLHPFSVFRTFCIHQLFHLSHYVPNHLSTSDIIFLLLLPPYQYFSPNGTTIAGGPYGDTTENFLPYIICPEKCLLACSFPLFGRKSTINRYQNKLLNVLIKNILDLWVSE